MSEPARTRPALAWQAVVAATVLAITAAGLVLLFAASRDGDDDGAAGTDAPPQTLDLRPIEDIPDGDPLDIEFTDVDGTAGTLRDLLDDEPLVVNYFASWCTPCVAEMPDFESVSQEVDDVRFFGLAVIDRRDDAIRIVDQTGVTYPWARDAKGDIAAAFGITNMPSTMFISADGEITHIQAGAVDAEKLRGLIEEHLTGAA